MDQLINPSRAVVDFSNTEIAFASKSDKELRKMAWLFGLMNKHWLVGIGSKVGIAAIRLHLPFVESVVKNTIFEQFCAGTTLDNSVGTIQKLFHSGVRSVLDYGVEAKESEEEFDRTMEQNLEAIRFAAEHESASVISIKLTGLARFRLLEELNGEVPDQGPFREEWDRVLHRLINICETACRHEVMVYIDAEESWIQPSIDLLVNLMMSRFNRERAIVYNTFQLYRTDHLDHLKASFERALSEGWVLGAKLVRGAYMEKERARAEEKGYPSPIQPDKAATDRDFNEAIRFCVENYQDLASCNASHNVDSNLLQAQLIEEKGIPKDHPHLRFAQLYGMSDNISFNLAHKGYQVEKYLVYGAVQDVVPYLIRRAQENSSVTGDMSREHRLVRQEMERRGLS